MVPLWDVFCLEGRKMGSKNGVRSTRGITPTGEKILGAKRLFLQGILR